MNHEYAERVERKYGFHGLQVPRTFVTSEYNYKVKNILLYGLCKREIILET